jgi:hypothetical protein
MAFTLYEIKGRELVDKGIIPEDLLSLGQSIAEFLKAANTVGCRMNLEIDEKSITLQIERSPKYGPYGYVELRCFGDEWILTGLNNGIIVPHYENREE